MLGTDGNPMPDIFIGDNLHMNAKGYAIWRELIEPHLLK
jgi:lysophospholipase L1-like esterase